MTNPAMLSKDAPILSVTTLLGYKVQDTSNQDLGKIEELMVDTQTGRIGYAVLSFGGLLGLGDRLFAIPWSLLTLNRQRNCFILDVPKERLEDAPGFDKAEWPNMADLRWGGSTYEYYGQKPYWAAEHGPKRD